MKIRYATTLLAVLFFAAGCGQTGAVGDECETTADCDEDLECHLHEHDGVVSDHGECEAHDHEEGHTDEE